MDSILLVLGVIVVAIILNKVIKVSFSIVKWIVLLGIAGAIVMKFYGGA